MTTVTYVSPSAPSLVLSPTINEKKRKIQFANKELHLDSEEDIEVIKALDKLIKERPTVSQLIQKVNPEVAEKLAKEHMEQMRKLRGTVKGAISSADMAQQTRARMAERDFALSRDGADPADVKEMHEEIDKDTDFILTEGSEDKIAPSTREGFVEDKQPAPIEAVDTPPQPKEIFANLLGKT